MPKNTDKISWTKHSIEKMRFYNLTPQRVLRVLRRPDRCQEAVAPGCIACMQSLKNKAKSEIWLMYQNKYQKLKIKNQKLSMPRPDSIRTRHDLLKDQDLKKIVSKKIITAWRYPTVSPTQDKIPIPQDILDEITDII